MQLIAHRRNQRDELRDTPKTYGVEIDLRSAGDRLILHHDPFVDGVDFESWLSDFAHKTLILNVKEEGLEQRLIKLMVEHGISDYFFLDQSFNFLVRTARTGERRCAVRVSEYEPVELALSMADMVDWVWVDCFMRFPLDGTAARRLTDAGLRLCVASPELHGRSVDTIAAMREELAGEGIDPAAVCTKRPDLWE